MADIIELIYADHDWFRRQFLLLDDAKSKVGDSGDPVEETDDAIGDHNSIRDAVRKARDLEVGSDEWFEAVGEARTENGEHLDEEEREALPDFIKSSTLEQRHELAMQWLRFYAAHPAGKHVDDSDKDPETYIEANS